VAHLRAERAGDIQPNAIAVRDFYREKAPVGLLSDIDLMEADQLELQAESMIEAMLAPMLTQLDLDFLSLGIVGGALAVMSSLVRSTPGPAPERFLEQAVEDAPSIERPPPDDEVHAYATMYAPPAAPDVLDEAEDDAPVAPAAEASGFDGYEGLYAPPERTGEE
jgi:hypothetical protein